MNNAEVSTELNPFEGLKRKRLPGMHMMIACDGGMPLGEALAAHFFVILHDRVKHNCLIKKALNAQEERIHQAEQSAKSLESITFLNVFGMMGASSLVSEEWSYLDDEDTFIFHIMASTAVEQVQRWIAEGSHKPFELSLLGGKIVERPQWAVDYFGTPDSEQRSEARECVKKLLSEIDDQ